MSIKAEKQLAVLRHQFTKLQQEHKMCEELITSLKKDKDNLQKKCDKFENELKSRSTSKRRISKKKEGDK